MGNDVTGWIGAVLGICLTTLAGFVLLETIRSNGETDYCYVEMWSPPQMSPQMSPQWMLKAHRPWREDRDLGVYGSIDEASAHAETVHCKLNGR